MFLSRPPESALSDDEHEADDGNDADSDEEDTPRKQYAFPELDQRIRDCVKEYEAVFPKLNFSSPKVRRELKSIICIILTNPAMALQDAAWLLPASSPLKCTSPSDVYLLLKSSDFINHDLSTESVFEGCEPESGSDPQPTEYELELVLRKWYPVDRGRELRCFVRDGLFIGTTYPFPYLIGSVLTSPLSTLAISQRDTNYYEFWNHRETKEKVTSSLQAFWNANILPKWTGPPNCTSIIATHSHMIKDLISIHPKDTFDFLLTRDLAKGHILDFNPYSPKTDSLLFTYEELRDLLTTKDALDQQPVLRVIDSALHPAATKNAPAYQHNMIPFEAVSMSDGRDIEEFADLWKESVKETMQQGN